MQINMIAHGNNETSQYNSSFSEANCPQYDIN